jgi:hypothetical protein
MTPRRRQALARFRKAIAKQEGTIRRAFEQAVRERKESINLTALAAAIEARDIGRAIDIAGITRADMFPLDQAAKGAYFEGGGLLAAEAPAFAARIALDGNAPRAVEWARANVGELITRVVEEQRDNIRTIITQHVADGRGPVAAARAVRAEIGLTSQQSGFVDNARGAYPGPS